MKRISRAALRKEREALDKDLIARQVARAKKRESLIGADIYSTDDEVYKLWSDGEGDSIFKNTHGCWDYVRIINYDGRQLGVN